MENDVRQVQSSTLLYEAAAGLVARCIETATLLLGGALADSPQSHGGRKGNAMHAEGKPASAR